MTFTRAASALALVAAAAVGGCGASESEDRIAPGASAGSATRSATTKDDPAVGQAAECPLRTSKVRAVVGSEAERVAQERISPGPEQGGPICLFGRPAEGGVDTAYPSVDVRPVIGSLHESLAQFRADAGNRSLTERPEWGRSAFVLEGLILEEEGFEAVDGYFPTRNAGDVHVTIRAPSASSIDVEQALEELVRTLAP